MTSVVLIEDDPTVREVVRELLSGAPGKRYPCLGEAGTIAEARQLCARTRPDVLLLDLGLPDGSGADLLRELRAARPELVGLVMSVFGDDAHVFDALRAGAIGYLLKEDITTRLLPSLDDLVAGGAPMTPSIARRVLKSLHEGGTSAPGPAGASGEPTLTDRELEVTKLLALGASYDEIARAMSISTNTVRTHIRNIYDKLHVSSRTEAAMKAVRLGLVPER
jgi:DNA-binding NarL/FixJ family response regulator